MAANKRPSKGIQLLGLFCAAVLTALAQASPTFSVATDSTFYRSDLVNVYGGFSLPQFSQLKWCLLDSNGSFVFLYCNGLDFSVIFDGASFLQGKTAQPPATATGEVISDFQLLQKISEEETIPQMI